MKDRKPTCELPSRRRAVKALPALLVLGAALQPAQAGLQQRRESRLMLGTRVDLVAQGRSQLWLAEAMDSAFAEMARLSASMSRYEPGSAVSAINKLAGKGEAMPISAELMAVLQTGADLHARTDGMFDMTVGSLKSWHFEVGSVASVPSAAVLAREQCFVGSAGLILDTHARSARLARAGMALDLGGVAKLPILAAGMQVLRDQGVKNALINGGGDVLYLGANQGRPWRVGVRDPRRPQRVLGVLPLAGQGVLAASGDYERYFFENGQRHHHVLDPKTGRPSLGAAGVSLWARDVESLNGLGAAFMIGGREFARDWVSRSPGLQVLLVGQDQAIWSTPGIKDALQS
ncbi:FAD:protein FMN transferase [Roseateles albus]|uniref:FAD:protein FMN transferase n=1 Tax=Roseateles albus TaxID=2987525 RepID=A0ABT5KBH6_9BURK|nr:FAD:protein FMN transferase [Roseateles albus]MDC8771291.1 FAD:protein FMN transferase [Roseateles albus]